MKFLPKVSKPASVDVDTLYLFCWENNWESAFREFPLPIVAEIREAAKRENFSGKRDESLALSSKGLISAFKLILIGLGKKSDFNLSSLRDRISVAMRKAKENKAVKVAIVLLPEWLSELGAKEAVGAIVEAVILSTYRFLKYKSEEERKKWREIEEVILNLPAAKLPQAEEGIEMGQLTGGATIYARDLVNEPPQLTTPTFLAQEANKISKISKGLIKVTILERDEAAKMGMEAFLGVSRGSDEPPKFIVLRYRLARSKKKICLIGKSITFDTGGLSLKSAENMETMKLDMAGGASILGIFSALAQLKLPIDVVGILPVCENMPSGKALKPGDILKALNGKTIEVLNTDAEGRLTLADALSYAVKKEKPDEIIDLSTLTGACMVALGQNIAGLFGNSEKLLESLEKAANATGEKIWRMPLEKSYQELIKSHIADVKNIQTGKYGGAITAALFLDEFTAKTPWAHLDIAGPAFMEKDTPLNPQGGAGFGVRLILHYLGSI